MPIRAGVGRGRQQRRIGGVGNIGQRTDGPTRPPLIRNGKIAYRSGTDGDRGTDITDASPRDDGRADEQLACVRGQANDENSVIIAAVFKRDVTSSIWNQRCSAVGVAISAGHRHSSVAAAGTAKCIGISRISRQGHSEIGPPQPVAIRVAERGRTGVIGHQGGGAAGHGEDSKLIRLRSQTSRVCIQRRTAGSEGECVQNDRLGSRGKSLPGWIAVVGEIIEGTGQARIAAGAQLRNVIGSRSRIGRADVREDVGAHRLQTKTKHSVVIVTAAGGDRAAADGDERDFAAGVSVVCRHRQRSIAAARWLSAESIRVGLVRAERHVDPAPLQPVAVGEIGIRRAERDEQRRRASAHRVNAQIIRRRARVRAVAAARIQSTRLDGDRYEIHCVGSGGERLAGGRIVVGVVIEPVRKGLVALGRELGDVVRAWTRRDHDVRQSLRVQNARQADGEKQHYNQTANGGAHYTSVTQMNLKNSR